MAVNARKLAGAAVIVGTFPYLALKLLWLTGNPVGLTDPAFADDTSLHYLNLATAAMDFGAVLLAFALTQNWGLRLPAWLVLIPIWIGTGFLVPILLAAPLIGTETDPGTLPLAPWVQPLVYGGFAWQGAALLVAFVLYARARWPWFGTTRTTAGTTSVTVWVGAALGVFVVATGFARGELIDILLSILALAGLVGVSVIVGRWRAGSRIWLPAVAGWLGTGAMFSWGSWGVVNVVGNTALVSEVDPVGTVADVAKVFAAVLLAYGATRSPDLRTTRYAPAPALP